MLSGGHHRSKRFTKNSMEIKTCKFCENLFVDNTKYNHIACKAIPCQAKYVEWVHGDKNATNTCQKCGSQYHPNWLDYLDKGICWLCNIRINRPYNPEQLSLFPKEEK